MPTPFHRAAVHLRHATSIVLCAHVNPDGDAVGATLALTLALREAGLPAIPTLADAMPPPGTYSFLPGFALYTPVADLPEPDAFVAIDTPSIERLGQASEMASLAETLITIDHHPDNSAFGTVNIGDPSAASSSQLVWHLLERLEIVPTPDVALCCYVGLMTDTGRFQYDNTSAQALRDAAEMIEAGVDAADAARLVYQERSPASLALEARALSRLQLANEGRVAWSWITDADLTETGALPEEAEYLPDAVRVIAGIDVALLLRISDGAVRGNLRAKRGFDVGAIARDIGGGGHRAAAGFTWEGDMDSLLERILPGLPGGRSAS